MSNQPFKDEDVVLRLPQDAYSFERVFTTDPCHPFGINMYWNVGGKWCPCLPTLQDVAEILRQLAEKGREIAELRAALATPEVYAGLVSRNLEQERDRLAEQLAAAIERNEMLAAEVARLKDCLVRYWEICDRAIPKLRKYWCDSIANEMQDHMNGEKPKMVKGKPTVTGSGAEKGETRMIEDIKRYKPRPTSEIAWDQHVPLLGEHPSGEYVRFADLSGLVGELDSLREKNATLKALLRESDDSQVHQPGCDVVRIGGHNAKCNCLLGRIRVALDPQPVPAGAPPTECFCQTIGGPPIGSGVASPSSMGLCSGAARASEPGEEGQVQAERARIIGVIEQTPCYCRETYTCTRCEILAAVRAAQDKMP